MDGMKGHGLVIGIHVPVDVILGVGGGVGCGRGLGFNVPVDVILGFWVCGRGLGLTFICILRLFILRPSGQ